MIGLHSIFRNRHWNLYAVRWRQNAPEELGKEKGTSGFFLIIFLILHGIPLFLIEINANADKANEINGQFEFAYPESRAARTNTYSQLVQLHISAESKLISVGNLVCWQKHETKMMDLVPSLLCLCVWNGWLAGNFYDYELGQNAFCA